MVPVFLFSLPRSGSTLAQRILAAHDEISTTPEPWILLPFLYTLKKRGIYAEYRHDRMTEAVEDFVQALPEGRKDYDQELAGFIKRLYQKAAKGKGRYFLDKTPRYHLVLDDILRLFPEGKFIFLWRHPLAVIASIIDTWGNGKWNLFLFKVDLFDGLSNLIEAFERNRDRVFSVRYEDLISDPEKQWNRIFTYLDLPFDETVLKSFINVNLEARMGDQTGSGRYDSISMDSINKWKQLINNPVRKAWCRRYLRWIGKNRLGRMGYDLDELLAELDAVPSGIRRTVSDLVRMAAGVAYCLVEPQILWNKMKALPHWYRVHVHR